jgi:adenine C2-methylase RlmN of 23S rRNA A2503 and tRNA A37
VNDSVEDARRLAEMTEGLDCVVNLIEFNTHEGAVFQPSPKERVGIEQFVCVGVDATIG